MKRKLLSIVLISALVLSLTACGTSVSGDVPEETGIAEEAADTEDDAETASAVAKERTAEAVTRAKRTCDDIAMLSGVVTGITDREYIAGEGAAYKIHEDILYDHDVVYMVLTNTAAVRFDTPGIYNMTYWVYFDAAALKVWAGENGVSLEGWSDWNGTVIDIPDSGRLAVQVRANVTVTEAEEEDIEDAEEEEKEGMADTATGSGSSASNSSSKSTSGSTSKSNSSNSGDSSSKSTTDEEIVYYNRIRQETFACNGCGYPLYTVGKASSMVSPTLFSDPWSHPEYNGCSGGIVGYHSEIYCKGYCYFCGGVIEYRQCSFTGYIPKCSANTALGSYKKIETKSDNCFMYLQSCACGKNTIMVDGATGKGMYCK